jgi:hypothetical protein
MECILPTFSNVPAERLVELLHQHEVATVLDVRSTPYSRYNPQYNRETIQRTLEEAGIAYAYAGDYLGGRPNDPACYENDTVSCRLVATQPWFRRARARRMVWQSGTSAATAGWRRPDRRRPGRSSCLCCSGGGNG